MIHGDCTLYKIIYKILIEILLKTIAWTQVVRLFLKIEITNYRGLKVLKFSIFFFISGALKIV